MAKINIPFDNTNYSVDEASLAAATTALKSHLSTVMNGAGATITLDGTAYGVDSAKLSAATNAFVSHLGTIAGTGKKVIVGGVEYSVDAAKMAATITDMHTALSGLQSGGSSGDEESDGERHDDAIAEGAYYGNFATGTFYSEMPATVSDGDIYLFGDYVYQYDTEVDGWAVILATEETNIQNYIPNYPLVDKNQTTYGTILESINNKPIRKMHGTFYNCTNLTESPAIPNSVVNMESLFYECHSLVVAPPSLPNNVQSLNGTFHNCNKLKTYAGSTDANGDFSNYMIPNTVTDMHAAFYACELMTVAPVIPDSVTDLGMAFLFCPSLTGTIEIPCSCDGQNVGYDNISIRHFDGCGH